jgi:glycosyltransferase involved in cell wall biosynthesis
MKVSIVSPVYNEENIIESFVSELCLVCNSLEIDYEIFLVDDGSTDGTWEIITKLTKKLPKLRAIRLLRNYGKDAALFVGLQNIGKTNFVITIDSDLQHPPKFISELLQELNKGFDIVYATKNSRPSETKFARLAANFLYRVLSVLHKDITPMKTDFLAFTNHMRLSILGFENKNIPLKGAILSLKPLASSIKYLPGSRLSGSTQWTLSKKLALAVKLTFSFSAKPIALIFVIALSLLLIAIVLSLQVFYQVLIGNALPGFATVILLQLISLASILFSLVIGFTYTYLSFKSTYLQNMVIVKDKINLENE